MTCVAYDGKVLAADKRTSFGGLHATTTKIHRLPDGRRVGGAGNTALIKEMLAWLEGGSKLDAFPAAQRSVSDCASMLVIDGNSVLHYENSPYPIVIENPIWAIGSGRDFAMAVMHEGGDARRAVEVACILESGCGNGVDVLEP